MRNVIIGKKNKVSVNSQEAYRHYKKKSVHRNKENTYTHADYSKIITAFYRKVARDLVENDGGVFIKNLGYFTILKHPNKQVVKVPYLGGKEFFNQSTGNYLYTPSFFGFGKARTLLRFWVMDRAFSKHHVKGPLHKKLIAGKTYKTFISTLFGLYRNNNN